MELRVLNYFLTVARKENISAAADFLHITQPTLSRQLIDLESELGVKLFIRGKRKITLTEEGIILQKRAEEITDLVKKTESEVTTSNKLISGNIFIGGGETHAMHLLTDILNKMQKKYPEIKIHIYSGNAEDVTEKLEKGLLDFGLLIQPTDVSKYESLSIPAKDTWGILMRKDSPLAHKNYIKPEDLWDIPLISSRQRMVSGDMEKWMQNDYDELNIVATYNLAYNASLMVEDGIGYAICIDKIINTAGDSPLCFKPLSPQLTSGLDVVWKKHQIFSKASQMFLSELKKRF